MKKPKPSVSAALQKRDVSAKRHLEAEGAGIKRVESAKPVADSSERRQAETLDEVERLVRSTGIRDVNLSNLIITQMCEMQLWCRAEDETHRVLDAIGALREIDPKNATEALLAVQMFAVHNAAVKFLSQATLAGQTFEGADANVLRAARLMHLFNEQLEAMAKLKGKSGRQKVTVEHVHVQSGGQAIVGVLERPDEKERA